MKTRHWISTILAAASLLAPAAAWAFCGVYVSGGEEGLFNEATQVALMRAGDQTVLSMENNYRGPAKDFAMIVPVPVVLQQEDVKTLDSQVFRDLDRLSAPRLVQYSERNPCEDRYRYEDQYPRGCPDENNTFNNSNVSDMGFFQDMSSSADMGGPPPVVEAEFSVGEYDIVVLSAQDSTGLTTWLKDNFYNIPAGAEDVLQGYIAQGMYFFVAKIDASKVTYDAGRAVLSPLRFHYTSQGFSLPVRLGMINSAGEQDLIVYLLGRDKRFEMANYPNAIIETNINVKNEVREDYAGFYEQVFARTLQQTPGAVVTEYAWGGFRTQVKCDPCPPDLADGLSPQALASLGGDVLLETLNLDPWEFWNTSWVLTRLHARYSKEDISEDLVFREAGFLEGGNGTAGQDHIETRTAEDGASKYRFQGRYIIHRRWGGPIACEDAVRYRWGRGSGSGSNSTVATAVGPNSQGGVLPEPMGADLESLLDADIPATQGRIPIWRNYTCAGELIETSRQKLERPQAEINKDDPDLGGTPDDMGDDARDAGADTGESFNPSAEGGGNCSSSPLTPASGTTLGLLALLGAALLRRRRLG